MHYRIRPRKDSGIYWIDIHHPSFPGGRHRASLETRDPEEAERRAKQAVADAQPSERAVGYQALSVALETVIASKSNASTRQSYRAKAKRLTSHFGDECNILALDEFDVQEYMEARRFRVGTHTLHKELSLLRQTWEHYCAGRASPVPRYRAGYQPRKRFLTVEEAQALLHEARNSKFRPWLWFALYTSAEPAAMSRMKWSNIDFRMRTVHVLGSKAETRDRVVPLHPELEAFLGTLSKREPLFPFWPGTRRTVPMRKWCTRAGIEPCTLTDLRRTFGSWMKQAGADSKRVADLMGHVNTQMVDRVYGQLNAASYRDAVDMLPRLTVVK